MTKFQGTVIGVVAALTLGLYALTQDHLFGSKKTTSTTVSHSADDGHNHGDESASLSTDTILLQARATLSPPQRDRLTFLENSITRGDVADQKVHLYHRLAAFWRDTGRLFEPFAWYTGEAARLENSEKSLTFAAHLFLNNLRTEEDPALKNWKASQAKDLFERSLKLDPANDSSQVGLGATYLYGGMASPMEGILKIRGVAERDSTNIYAQLTLGEASMISGQLDKAAERYRKVVRLDPSNVQALFALADVYERMGNKKEAVAWYQKTLPLIPIPGYRKEVENRIEQLKR
ncbi:MAG: Tetratricopeptide repeat-containing protein [Flaviaesturariibacter sp.]|nr:Tetratricopeptide repeat-containing protein [Flaviaesturariibacter sp.]